MSFCQAEKQEDVSIPVQEPVKEAALPDNLKNDVKEAAFAALSKAERDRINKQSKEMVKVREKTKERTSRESREEK